MPKKHRPKRGVIRKTGTEVYFAYIVLATLCLVLALHLSINSITPSNNEDTPSATSTNSRLQVTPSGDTPGGQQEALNELLQSSDSGQEALQGSVNSQPAGAGSDQLQPSTGKEAYEAYEN